MAGTTQKENAKAPVKAATETSGEVVVFDPAKMFKVKKRVTLPILKLVIGVPYYVRIEEAIVIGKKVEADKEPAHLVTVVELESQSTMQIVLNTVLKSTFEDEYENESYVGKTFEIIKGEKKTGKQYHPFSVIELEVV